MSVKIVVRLLYKEYFSQCGNQFLSVFVLSFGTLPVLLRASHHQLTVPRIERALSMSSCKISNEYTNINILFVIYYIEYTESHIKALLSMNFHTKIK